MKNISETEANVEAKDSAASKTNNEQRIPLIAKELKERISFVSVLRADGIKVDQSGRMAECRCPNPEHQDNTPSFKIYDDERAYCFGCEWKGDVINYVEMRDKTDFSGACAWLEANIDRIARNTPFRAEARNSTATKALTDDERKRMAAASAELLNDPAAWQTTAEVRGWDPDTVRYLAEDGSLGWHKDQLAFVYETGMKVRDWPGRDFRWNCGSPSLWRSNKVEEGDAVFIAEGETDGISLIDAGVEACGGTVVAIPSSTTIRPEWFQAWKVKKVMLCFDNDEAGRRATEKMIRALKGIVADIRVVSWDGTDFEDISDAHQKLGADKLMDWLETALKPVDPESPKGPPAPEPPNGPSAPGAGLGSGSGGNGGTPPTPAAPSVTAGVLPAIYYSVSTKEYLVKADGDTWIPVNENSVKRHLKALGYAHGKETGADATPLELCLNEIQRKQSVVYAAPLAGHDAGIHYVNGVNVLATRSPHYIAPVAGAFPTITEMLKRMFVTEAKDQRPYLFGWLKVHLQSFQARRWHPHQALALCGPVDCGKSLLQRLITEMFGGRSAKPHQFMSGTTGFNADLFEAEHLMIEDDAESTQHAQRKAFGAHIKAFAANKDQRCHGKYQKGLTLHPLWAVTISVNDEPQRLLVLPPIDQDTEDKITLLKVNQCKMPMPTDTIEQKDIFWKTLVGELPAFAAFLQSWEIPHDLRSAKYGVKHYHDPDILQAVDEVSNEFRLLSLIDKEIPFHRGEAWKGTAHDLEQELSGENSGVQYEARKLFYFPTACGTYLANLAKKLPDRVEKLPRKDNNREWQINPIPGKRYQGMVFSQTCSSGDN